MKPALKRHLIDFVEFIIKIGYNIKAPNLFLILEQLILYDFGCSIVSFGPAMMSEALHCDPKKDRITWPL